MRFLLLLLLSLSACSPKQVAEQPVEQDLPPFPPGFEAPVMNRLAVTDQQQQPPVIITMIAIVDPVDSATQYNVYEAPTFGAPFVLIASNSQPVIPFPARSPGQGYIGVKAVNLYGESGWAKKAKY